MSVARFEPEQQGSVPSEDGDGCFADLVRAHHRELLVYATALTRDPVTARDVVQDAFVVAYEKREVFDVTRDFPAWMRGIVRNKWREWLRRNRRYDLGEPELARIDAAISAWQSGRLHGESPLFAELEGCLSKLPAPLHEAVVAYYYEGRSGDETAHRLGIAPAAVRKRLQRARILLRQCLDRKRPGTELPQTSPE